MKLMIPQHIPRFFQPLDFGKWTKESNATVQFPYDKVNDVIILESKNSEGPPNASMPI